MAVHNSTPRPCKRTKESFYGFRTQDHHRDLGPACTSGPGRGHQRSLGGQDHNLILFACELVWASPRKNNRPRAASDFRYLRRLTPPQPLWSLDEMPSEVWPPSDAMLHGEGKSPKPVWRNPPEFLGILCSGKYGNFFCTMGKSGSRCTTIQC